MAFFRRAGRGDEGLPKDDRGSGSFDDYVGVLVPKKKDVVIRLADSARHQEELAALVAEGFDALATATPARSLDDERVDAVIEVRLFSGRRVSGVVGMVPRGLESIYDEAVRRLDGRGSKPRIPVTIVQTKKHGYRLDLLIGQTK
jgi:site-specific recombinase XerD